MVRVGLVQMAMSEDREENLECALAMASEAAAGGARVICLPELFLTRYFPQYRGVEPLRFTEPVPGEMTGMLARFAREHGVVLIAPLCEEYPGGRSSNTACVFSPEGLLLPRYRKVHVPQDPCFWEKDYFREGDAFQVYRTAFGTFAVLICYDQWFPEAARAVSLEGADLILYPTAIGWMAGEEDPYEGDWRDAWETVQRGHAIANSVWVAAVNRVGIEDNIHFWGSSFVSDPFGKIIARAGNTSAQVLYADVDPDRSHRIREGWGFFRNRRPDCYCILVAGGEERGNATVPGTMVSRMSEPCLLPGTSTLPGVGAPLQATPWREGFRMPAEWEPQEAVWLAWPYDRDTFSDLPAVEAAYLTIIRTLAGCCRVDLLVTGTPMAERVSSLLSAARIPAGQVTLHTIPYADVWIRDYGPTFLVNSPRTSLSAVRWRFNAWGEKYDSLMRDDGIAAVIGDKLAVPVFSPGIVLEGGSIEVNGQGTVLTTEQCLLNPNRNPYLSRGAIEGILREYLGCRHVIWLSRGIEGDDTDGHIDDIARFCNPSTVLCALSSDPSDPDYPVLQENYQRLSSAVDQDGRPLTVIPLPVPSPVVADGVRLPASYANFLVSNRVILVPAFEDPRDTEACRVISAAFPGREVVPVPCRAMVYGLGSLHCISQQQPLVRRTRTPDR